jgi:hypothetical protein
VSILRRRKRGARNPEEVEMRTLCVFDTLQRGKRARGPCSGRKRDLLEDDPTKTNDVMSM